MTVLLVLKIIAAIGTLLTGLIALLQPKAAAKFLGFSAAGPRGVTETRVLMGAVFIALGMAPLLLSNSLIAYRVVGIMYLEMAAVRLASMFIDHSQEQATWISLALEAVFGVILVL
jgi:hypothetical protein